MRRKIMSSYSDGVAKFYAKKDISKNVKSLDDLDYLGFLNFDERSIRHEDFEFAEQSGARLTMKIATPDNGNMNAQRNILIENVIYSIINIDRDKEKRELFFYLEEVRKI